MSAEAPVDKRRSILDAAIRVFARNGYHGTRVSDIADEAGVAYGLVYSFGFLSLGLQDMGNTHMFSNLRTSGDFFGWVFRNLLLNWFHLVCFLDHFGSQS